MLAAEKGHLPVVEYLLERGADLEARDKVSHVIIDVKLRTSHMNTPVNVSGWIHSIDICCNERSFTNG